MIEDPVKVIIDRSSVAMGDDVESHLQFWEMPASATVDDLLIAISNRLLPGVAGPAGWAVYSGLGDLPRRQLLGMIFTRDDLRQEHQICCLSRGETLGRLAHRSQLVIDAIYFSGARPAPVSEVMASALSTGAQPHVMGSLAEQRALVDWRQVNENVRLARSVQQSRRTWVREHLLTGTPPPGVESFVAENFHLLYTLPLCPASMGIVGELLGRGDEIDTGTQVLQATGEPTSAILAMVIAAFEWSVENEDLWTSDDHQYCTIYLEFLERHGYQLSPIEAMMAGQRAGAEVDPTQARVRQLRNAEYHLGRNHHHGVMDHEQYLAALAPVSTELRQLGAQPEPPMHCCGVVR